MRPISRYVFVDGEYLDMVYRHLMNELMGDDGELDLRVLGRTLSPEPDRYFYYHSLDDEARGAEDARAFQERVGAQLARYDAIAAIPRFHTRLGSVTGKAVRRRRQKQVDVQLAVDALTHAFNKNMTQATLFAGDLDFKPLVDALVALGVHTDVLYEASSASRALYRAADEANAISPITAWHWSSTDYRRTHSLPTKGLGHQRSTIQDMDTVATGHLDGAQAVAARDDDGLFWVWIDATHGRESFVCSHPRLATIECFIRIHHASVTWTERRDEAEPRADRP